MDIIATEPFRSYNIHGTITTIIDFELQHQLDDSYINSFFALQYHNAVIKRSCQFHCIQFCYFGF